MSKSESRGGTCRHTTNNRNIAEPVSAFKIRIPHIAFCCSLFFCVTTVVFASLFGWSFANPQNEDDKNNRCDGENTNDRRLQESLQTGPLVWYNRTFRNVNRVIDGDTICMNGRLRFACIDTPEIGRFPFQDEPGAQEARRVVRNSLKNGFDVHIHRVDSFGRLIVTIIVDGDNLNLRLVEQGYAKVFCQNTTLQNGDINLCRQTRLECENVGYWEKEKSAQEQKLGVWGQKD